MATISRPLGAARHPVVERLYRTRSEAERIEAGHHVRADIREGRCVGFIHTLPDDLVEVLRGELS